MKPEDAIRVEEVFKLTDFNVPGKQTTWPRVSLSNTDLLCAIHDNAEWRTSSNESVQSSLSKEPILRSKVQIINANGKVVSQSQTKAESAKIHPSQPIIALKGGTLFQVFNFESKNLLSSKDTHDEVLYWNWANEETIIFVTENSILQWLVFTGRELEYVCHRSTRLFCSEIVNCAVDDSHRWYTITGLIDHGTGCMVEGITQVYSADYRLSQCIEAHCTAFVNKQLEGNLYESIVMCAASRMLESHIGKVHTIELSSPVPGNEMPRLASSDLTFATDSLNSSDFPVSIQADLSHSVVYVMTKFGHLYVSELESAQLLTHTQISSHITFCSSLNSLSILTIVSKTSQVLHISIDWFFLIKYVREVLKKPAIADRLQNSRGMENVDLLLDSE